jgi:exosome complex component RRP41
MALFKQTPPDWLIKEGIRRDGRKVDELRPISIEIGTVPKADGSALINMGKNKILVAVYGPREVHPRHLARQDAAVLRCLYRMATFA